MHTNIVDDNDLFLHVFERTYMDIGHLHPFAVTYDLQFYRYCYVL